MKKLFLPLLAVSLLLNAGFAFLFLTRADEEAPPTVLAKPALPAAPVIDKNVWPDLQTADLPSLITRLRASGFPPKIIRAIILAQIHESFAAQRKALSSLDATTPFWKSAGTDPQRTLGLLRLDREEQKTLKSLLGEDPEAQAASESRANSLSYLPAEKAKALDALLKSIEQRRTEYFVTISNGVIDRSKFEALDKERNDAVAALLTPAELFEYKLRESSTALQLREQLSAFDPSEKEYRELFALQEKFDAQWDAQGLSPLTMNVEQRKQYQEAQKALTEQMKATLDPARAAEYERASNYDYRRSTQLLARLELPASTANSLWDLKSEYQKKMEEVAKGATSRTEAMQRLTALQQEASARVAPLLGDPSRVDLYKQYGGAWITNLVPRPPPKR